MGLKIAVIGGASSYTPELFADLADFRDALDVEHVALMDLNGEKLSLIASVGRKLVQDLALPVEITATENLAQAVTDADFTVLQIRVGGLEARIRDESLPMELGMIGNETTGAGGFVCGLRTVRVALEIAREIERIAPRACLLNLSNPAGIVTEALLKHTGLRTIGFCNIPINTTYALADVLGAPADQVELHSFGLNHLSWVREARVDGKDRLQELIRQAYDRSSPLYERGLVEDIIDPEWLRALSMIPSWYVRYYYCTDEILEQERGGHGIKGRRDQEAEEQLRALYVSEGYGQSARHILSSKGGAQYYLPVLQVISAITHDSGKQIVVDVRNSGALPDLPPDVCVEVPARIHRDREEVLHCGPMPLSVRGLVQVLKAYEQLTVEAAVTGSHEAALAALVTHPLVGSYSKARCFWDRVLEKEERYLPQFFDRAAARRVRQ